MDENDRYAWTKNYTTMGVNLHNIKDADIIAEVKRRKERYNTSIGYTLRRWIRLGYEREQEQE